MTKVFIVLVICLSSLISFSEGIKKIGFDNQNYKKEIGFEKQRKKEEEKNKIRIEELKLQEQDKKEKQPKIEEIKENTETMTSNQLFYDDGNIKRVEKNKIPNNLNMERKLINYIKTQNRNISENEIKRILRAVFGYSKQYNINPYLVLAVMNTESHFKHSTVSRAGAKGLMQLMSFNFKEFGVDNTIEGNIKGGVMHLKRDYNKTGDVVKTLVCYNAGCGRLANNVWKGIKETREYIPRVIENYHKITNL